MTTTYVNTIKKMIAIILMLISSGAYAASSTSVVPIGGQGTTPVTFSSKYPTVTVPTYNPNDTSWINAPDCPVVVSGCPNINTNPTDDTITNTLFKNCPIQCKITEVAKAGTTGQVCTTEKAPWWMDWDTQEEYNAWVAAHTTCTTVPNSAPTLKQATCPVGYVQVYSNQEVGYKLGTADTYNYPSTQVEIAQLREKGYTCNVDSTLGTTNAFGACNVQAANGKVYDQLSFPVYDTPKNGNPVQFTPKGAMYITWLPSGTSPIQQTPNDIPRCNCGNRNESTYNDPNRVIGADARCDDGTNPVQSTIGFRTLVKIQYFSCTRPSAYYLPANAKPATVYCARITSGWKSTLITITPPARAATPATATPAPAPAPATTSTSGPASAEILTAEQLQNMPPHHRVEYLNNSNAANLTPEQFNNMTPYQQANYLNLSPEEQIAQYGGG